MNHLLLTLLLSGTLVLSQCSIVKDERKLAYYCTHICVGCQGQSIVRDNVCFCQAKHDEETESCMMTAKRKAEFIGMELVALAAPGKKFRPVRGSIIDPRMHNSLEKIHPSLKEQLSQNSIHKSYGRIFKRSLEAFIKPENEELSSMADNTFAAKLTRSIMPEIGNRDKLQGRERVRRSLTPFTYPQSQYQMPPPNGYDVIFELPSSREDEGDRLELSFEDSPGLDVEHEFYFQGENDDEDVDEDEENCIEFDWPQLSESSNHQYGPAAYPPSVMYNSPLMRDVRSPMWNYPEPDYLRWSFVRYY